MSTGSTPLSENGTPIWRRWLPRLRDTRIRAKLALILVVPLAAVIALTTTRLVSIGQDAMDATQVRGLTALSVDVSAVANELHKERMAAAAYLVAPTAKADDFNAAARRTDERVATYTAHRVALGSVSDSMQTQLQTIDDQIANLGTTREQVLGRRQLPVSELNLRYGAVLADLASYGDTLAQQPGEDRQVNAARAVAAFVRARTAAGEEQAVVFAGLSTGRLDAKSFYGLVATLTNRQEAMVAFARAANSDQQAVVNGIVTGDVVNRADQLAEVLTSTLGRPPAGVTAGGAADTVGALHDLMRQTEVQLQTALVAGAKAAGESAARQAYIESALALAILFVAILVALILARSLNESLRQLREGALAVANRDLPEAVSRLRDVADLTEGRVEEIVRQVRDPIAVSNRDEVGQVAVAFNVVHREAVRIAAEQAALRTSVSAMFLNLARRSQTLVDRMIGELDMIERSEEDPKRLAKLFELDHLATRMRRNDENLLVLAGADSAPPRREEALLVDVLRASQSEVELYNRIEFGTIDTDVSVAAHAVNDVVRLVAELLDNATRFSPPTTVVVADARRVRDHVVIQVEDRGLGLSDEQLESLNHRLVASSSVDVAAFRLMGLAVVSRLASRYGIRVELRRNPEGGTLAQVTLPGATVVLPKTHGMEPMAPLAVEAGVSADSYGASGGLGRRQPQALSEMAAGTGDDIQPYPMVTGLPRRTPGSEPSPQVPEPLPNPLIPPRPDAAPVVPAQPSGVPLIPARPGLGAAQPSAVPLIPPRPGLGTAQPPAVPLIPPRPGVAPVVPPGTGAAPLIPPRPGMVPAQPSGRPLIPTQPSSPPILPAGPVAGMMAASAPGARRPDEPTEAPIFKEMEAVWFRSHGNDTTAIFTMPPLDDEPPSAAGHRPGAAASPAAARPTIPAQRGPSDGSTGTGSWRTAADEGWALASRAAAPEDGGTTRSGLPKRVPQAQLVPGGVEPPGGRAPTRRTPDEVRGLLSAYHRGVQRGRSAGGNSNGTSTKETSR